MSFFKDVFLATKYSYLIPKTLSGNPDDNSENFLSNPEQKLIKDTFTLKMLKSQCKYFFNQPVSYDPIITCKYGDKEYPEDELFFFINGITVDRDFVTHAGDGLSKLMNGRKISILHNPTQGILKDIVEATLERSFNFKKNISLQLTGIVIAALKYDLKVRIIGHSQGAIIASNIVSIINKEYGPDLLKGLEVYTIGGAADELLKLDGIYAEHFYNENDFIAKATFKDYGDRIYGKKYMRRGANGHLLNSHYLGALKQGLYCNKESRFYREYIAK